jgi:hypothetical protein
MISNIVGCVLREPVHQPARVMSVGGDARGADEYLFRNRM